jgi:hypothetical protein
MLKHLGDAGEWTASVLTEVGVPYAGLVKQVLALSDRPLELLEGFSARPAPPELGPRVLTRLCRRGPVVWVVDDADLADGAGLWADLILGLADRIARDLPLALVLGVEGPRQLGSHEDDEPDSLYVARQLTADGRASWHPLIPIDRMRCAASPGRHHGRCSRRCSRSQAASRYGPARSGGSGNATG